jgi:hypothetical protein
MRRKLGLGLFAVGAVVAAAGGALRANGTIDVENAQIAAGTAPQQGGVVVDPCAPAADAPSLPALGALGAIGSKPGAVPAFPGGGPGGHDVRFTSQAILPGGTYDYSSYEVAPNTYVIYEGPTVIRTTNHVAIEGHVYTQSSGHDLTFVCGGDFRLGGASSGTVSALGQQSDLVLDVAGALFNPAAEGGATSEIRADDDLTIVARGGASSYSVDLRNTTLSGSRIGVVSAGGIRSDFGGYFATTGVRLDAFGGDVEVGRAYVTASAGPVVLEASGSVRLPRGFCHSHAGDALLTAFGGEVRISDGGYVYAYENSSARLRASGHVFLVDGAFAEVVDGSGTLETSAFGGDVVLQPVLYGASQASIFHQGTGPTLITAAGNVISDGGFVSNGGDLTVRALGGNVLLQNGAVVQSPGATDVGASATVFAGAPGTGASLQGGSLRVFGSAVRLHASSARATVGALTLTANGALTCAGSLDGATGVSATSLSGSITLDNAGVRTNSSHGARSGDIAVTSFAGATGKISAKSATIRSGDNATASGDVALRVHSPFAPTVTSFLLPTSASVKLGAVKGAGFRAAGTFGFPSDLPTVNVGGMVDFELTVGTRVVTGHLHYDGKTFKHKTATEQITVTPPRTGSSEGAFSFRIDDDLTGAVPADGTLELKLTLGAAEAAGSVVLTAGKFKLGQSEVLAPNLFPVKIAAKIPGGGRDTLTMTLGFSPGDAADAMQTLTIGFGEYEATIPASEFASAGTGRFLAKNPPSAPGLTSVTVDLVRGTVLVKGKALDLGAFPAATSVAVPITLSLGAADVRSVDVELSRKGSKLAY